MTPLVETEPAKQIVGEQLSGVTFLLHYLQLQFNPPPTVNAYTPVTVVCGNSRCMSGDDQFRNRLCDQISKIVKLVSINEEEAFVVTFEDNSEISISLRPSDYVGPEALEVIGRDNAWLVI